MFDDLFEFKALYEACPEYFSFGDVTFKRDFGPWKRGETVSEISCSIEGEPLMTQHGENGQVVKQCGYSLVATPTMKEDEDEDE